MKVLFVINPVAGGTDHSGTIDSIRQVTEERGYQSEFLLTKGESDKEDLIRCLKEFEPDRVIVGGGDGTIRMVAENLIPYKLTLGILPLGSANGLATALGIPANPIDALEKIYQSTRVTHMDMLRFNDEHLCIHVGDIGVNALLVKKYEEAGDRGMFGYAKNLLSAIQESPQLKMIVRTADGIVTKEGYMMAFANAHMYGTGVHISEGSVSDGKFEICNVEKIALDSAIKAGLTILNVFIDKNMFSDVISCREAEVEIDKKVHFQIDGEYMGMVDHLKIEALPGTVKLLI
jgi:diacylglycerol kinase family enzyme